MISRAQRERAARIFGDACDLPVSERAAFVAAQCAGDPALLDEVESLLAAHAEGTLRALETGALLPGTLDTADVPESVGPYRLLRPLGAGGFGTVWLAQQEDPVRRQVAVKLIKPGMDTAEVLARFERERETLAQLDHVNIARILDAGRTEQGRPYFALEYVEGSRVTDFCDEQRLAIEARLAVFLDICSAVQHAHQKGVIHRDLKPSNVLVKLQDGISHVRVIDFGIARALADEGDDRLTRPAAVVGTPAYMSPEQAVRGSAVDTRTDVYSLGVLLFELLTGSFPFETTPLAMESGTDLRRMIASRDPATPSSRVSSRTPGAERIAELRDTTVARLSRALRRELDWIVLKALAPDRERRYASVSEFAEDVRRFLRRDPVAAGPPSAAYKVRKFVERHRAGVITAGLVAVVTVAGLVGTSVALRRALIAETTAREEGERAQREASRADDLNHFLVEDILGSARIDRSGHKVTVVEAIANGLAALDERFADHPYQGAVIRGTIGDVYTGLGLLEEAVAQLKSAYEVGRANGPEDSDEMLNIRGALGNALNALNRLDEAEPILRRAYEAARARGNAQPDITLLIGRVWGEVLQKLGRHEQAEPLLRQIIDEMRTTLGPESDEVVGALLSLGASLQGRGEKAGAAAVFGEVYEIANRSLEATHPARIAALNNYATTVYDQGDYAHAAELYETLVADEMEALPAGHFHIGIARVGLGRALCHIGEVDRGMQELIAGYETLKAALGPTHYLVESSLSRLASIATGAGREEEARLYRRLTMETRFMAAANDQRSTLIPAIVTYVGFLTKLGLDEDAAVSQAWNELVKRADELGDQNAQEARRFIRNLGLALLDSGNAEAAEPWLRRYLEFAEAAVDASAVQDAAALMAELCEARGQSAEAEDWRKRAAVVPPSPSP